MKRYIGIIALFVGLSSCESLYEDGEWQKMELDKSGLYFNSFGGEEVVRVLNYESWRIAGGYEATEYIDGISYIRIMSIRSLQMESRETPMIFWMEDGTASLSLIKESAERL